MAHHERAVIASHNNADLYEAVFAAQGLRYQRHSFAFVTDDNPPPYYSHLTVLAPNSVDRVAPHVRSLASRFGDEISFKDSFCEFDAQGGDFRCLFEAHWVWRTPEAASTNEWVEVADPLELAAWEAAWRRGGSPSSQRVFGPAVLDSSDIAFLGKKDGGEFVAGCIANKSSECVGLSNVFSVDGDTMTFEMATKVVASLNPRLPIVGYVAGHLLNAAHHAGFERTGPLRVLQLAEPVS
jgi:hypothetical protein